MRNQRKISFKIASMDSLGQGVSKESDKITFIAKVLPEETGEAVVFSEKKGVQFASIERLSQRSPHRVDPVCVHFNACPSCHYLHTSYDQELKFKTQSLEKMFSRLDHPPIVSVGAVRRTHYRNRIQLHYDRKRLKLGLLNVKDQTIAPIPHCLIGSLGVTAKLKELYHQDSWIHLSQHQPPTGHVEIYETNGEVKLTWNRPYSEGGFTQVFDEMNQLLLEALSNWASKFPSSFVLDLFAGNGNMTAKMNYSQRLCVDIYQEPKGPNFFNQDLYAADALKNVVRKLNNQNAQPSLLVLDPPRSGHKNLNEWLEALKPERVAYISCDPHTLVRDITPLNNYFITGVELYDFFPSTFHFETMVFLERK